MLMLLVDWTFDGIKPSCGYLNGFISENVFDFLIQTIKYAFFLQRHDILKSPKFLFHHSNVSEPDFSENLLHKQSCINQNRFIRNKLLNFLIPEPKLN